MANGRTASAAVTQENSHASAVPLRIPFNRHYNAQRETEFVAQALRSGHLSGDGEFTRRCHSFLQQRLGVAKALLTTSCTHALEMAMLLLDVKAGDEVIVPSFTFVSTANAVALRGATVVFADIRRDTLNIDETKLEALITPRTRAIVPVHYAGVGCEMEAIGDIAARHGIAIVEDNAHGLLGRYRGQYLGTFGSLATQSFHETKNFSCGEGGALLINDASYIERAEILREKGTNRSRFFRGQVDKYTWVDVGSSYLPSEVLAAVLSAQIEAAVQIQASRMAAWNFYREHLAVWAESQNAVLPNVPAHCEHPAHIFYILMRNLEERQALIRHLRGQGILAVFHYVPLHTSEAGRRFGRAPGGCEVTEDISARLLRLPLYGGMTEEETASVVAAIRAFRQ